MTGVTQYAAVSVILYVALLLSEFKNNSAIKCIILSIRILVPIYVLESNVLYFSLLGLKVKVSSLLGLKVKKKNFLCIFKLPCVSNIFLYYFHNKTIWYYPWENTKQKNNFKFSIWPQESIFRRPCIAVDWSSHIHLVHGT